MDKHLTTLKRLRDELVQQDYVNESERDALDAAILSLERSEMYRTALERYANKGMWEYTYSKRRGGSCGDIHCPNHVCTKSEFMSKYNGWEYAEEALKEKK